MRLIENPVIDYINQTFAEEDALLAKVRRVGEALRKGMQVSPYEGKMLQTFIAMIGATRVVEVGTFVGYSAISMARALPADGNLLTLEFDSEHARIAREHFAESGLPITLIEGNAKEAIAGIKGEVDAIFIDADKISYPMYLEMLLPKLRSGGLVMGDNSLLFGAVVGMEPRANVSNGATEAMKQFNVRLANQEEFISVMVPTEEGLTIAVKR